VNRGNFTGIISEIIPLVMSVPQNPIRLVDERWFAAGSLKQNQNGERRCDSW
jgi:hypothetical protein